tara:strand:+ start:3195 stop:3581 length:387 start_codon:yes stop_codon:yes gene_type:complete
MKLKELLEDAKIRLRIVRDDYISLNTEMNSTAELSRMGKKSVDMYNKDFDMDLKEPVFYFNRIKAREEGKGEGTLMMKELIKILDEKKVTVINELNPYGNLNLEDLQKFYSKYGFVKKQDHLMIRKPK